MSTHALTVVAWVLWALVLIALCVTLNQGRGLDVFGRQTTPGGPFLALWAWTLALLFVAAVGLTAWVAP